VYQIYFSVFYKRLTLLHYRRNTYDLKIRNSVITPQYVWHVAESITKRDEPKAPTAIHGPSGLNYYLREKANTTADCLVITSYPMTCVTKKQWAEGGGYSSSTVRSCRRHPPGVRPHDAQKLINLWNWERPAKLIAFKTNISGTFQEDQWYF
jgi:hypothetical protein